MGKSKELSIDGKELILDLNKSGKSVGAFSKQFQVPRPARKQLFCKFKVHGTVALVRMDKSQPKTNEKQVGDELEAAGVLVTVSTVP